MGIHPNTYQAYNLMHEGILALGRAERAGFRVDIDYIVKKRAHLTRQIERLESLFRQTNFYRHWEHSSKGSVNINSNYQLSHFLYGVKKLKVEKQTESGQGSTDEETLQSFNIPELNDLLHIRKLKKIRDTYLESFEREQVDGYIHPFFNLNLVTTYRSSSDSPNFQNIPKRDHEAMQITRRALYPRPGHQIMEIDFSGMEVRVAACYHKDPTMLKYINNPKSDMHGDMAKSIFMIDKFDKNTPGHQILRQAAKNGFVFPEFYGDYYGNCAPIMACTWGMLPQGSWEKGQGIEMSEGFLSNHLISKGITSLNEFKEHLRKIEKDFWGKRFPVYAAWKEQWWANYQKCGYIDMYTGFRCGGVMGKNNCINYPVQGSAFHCLLWTFIELDKISRAEHWDSQLIGQIHDSMLLDVHPQEVELVYSTARRIACEALPKAWSWIIVPMDVDAEITPIDKSWADKEKYC